MNTIVNANLQGWKVSTAGRSLDVLSRQWMSRRPDEKFLSLPALQAHTKARADRMEEIRLSTEKLEIVSPEILDTDDRATALAKFNQLQFVSPGRDPVAPTSWAFDQVAGLAKAPSAWLKQMPGTNVANDLTYALRYNRGPEAIKLYADDLEATAITGPDYGRIFDWEVVEAVAAATSGASGDHRWKVPGMLDWSTNVYDPLHPVTKDTTTLFSSDRGVFMFLCQDLAPIEIGKLWDGSPDLVFRGFYVTNSEVGAGALKLGAMYLRAILLQSHSLGRRGVRRTDDAAYEIRAEPLYRGSAAGARVLREWLGNEADRRRLEGEGGNPREQQERGGRLGERARPERQARPGDLRQDRPRGMGRRRR